MLMHWFKLLFHSFIYSISSGVQRREEMIRKLIKTKSLHTSRKNASEKTAPVKSRRKNPEKINPQMKNKFYVIVVILLLYLGFLKE